MYARVARWEGGEAAAIRDTAAQIRQDAESSGPPEGVPATGITILFSPDGGDAMAITLFATEEDLRKGHETLSAMNPPGDGMGRRTSVELFEVAVDVRL